MNRKYLEVCRKIVSDLRSDLENDDGTFDLIDDMSRAEKILGREISEIYDCIEEAKQYSRTIRRNALTIIDLIEIYLDEQKTLSFYLSELQLNDPDFNKLIEQAFQSYKNTEVDTATEKIWDAFERIKTYFTQYDKKHSAEELIDVMSKNNDGYKKMLLEEFAELTKIGNDFCIRHHETDKNIICCKQHYEYLFYRCLSVLRLAVNILVKDNC